MRVAVLSDVHSNIVALEAVLKDARGKVDGYWFLGDAIGYGLHPVETLELLAERVPPTSWVTGNHEARYVGKLPDTPERKFGVLGLMMLEHNQPLIEEARGKSRKKKKQIEKTLTPNLPMTIHKRVGKAECILAHSGFNHGFPYYYFSRPDLYVYLFDEMKKKSPAQKAKISFGREREQVQILFSGHTHIPGIVYFDGEENRPVFVKVREGKFTWAENCQRASQLVVNPGSVGFPRDLIPLPSYVIFDTRTLEFNFRRVDAQMYDRKQVLEGYRKVLDNINDYPFSRISRLEKEKNIEGMIQWIESAPLGDKVDGMSSDWITYYYGKSAEKYGGKGSGNDGA